MLPIMLGILCLNSKSRARCPKPNLEKHMFEHLFLDFNAVTLSFVSYQCVIWNPNLFLQRTLQAPTPCTPPTRATRSCSTCPPCCRTCPTTHSRSELMSGTLRPVMLLKVSPRLFEKASLHRKTQREFIKVATRGLCHPFSFGVLPPFFFSLTCHVFFLLFLSASHSHSLYCIRAGWGSLVRSFFFSPFFFSLL